MKAEVVYFRKSSIKELHMLVTGFSFMVRGTDYEVGISQTQLSVFRGVIPLVTLNRDVLSEDELVPTLLAELRLSGDIPPEELDELGSALKAILAL